MSKQPWTYEQHAAAHAYFKNLQQEKTKRIAELEAERDKYKNVLEFLVVSHANGRVKMECVEQALKGN